MKFDKNIVDKMQKKPAYKTINNEDLLVEEFNLDIARKFTELKNIDDLLALINSVNKVIYKNSRSIKIQHLLYHAYHNKERYNHFYISKKSGGQRIISAPTTALKNIQTTLNYILSCVYKPQMPAHGFLKNRSVVTNAKYHIGKNYVYNIDIKNFFPSIHKARVEKRLQLPPFNLSNGRSEIAALIARLSTQKVLEYIDSLTDKKELLPLDNKKLLELPGNKKILEKFTKKNADDSFKAFAVLPQGAPTSPIISNFICDRLDRRLLGLAKRFNVRYTRYADDMTFSSMHNVYQDDSEFIVEMRKIITDQHFEINSKKTRLQKRGYRQEVTGVIVNDKTNVNRGYIKQLRAMLYSIEKFGVEKAQNSFIKHYKDDKGHVKEGVPDILNVLSGKIDYLKMVKGHEDTTYLKIKARVNKIVGYKEEPQTSKDTAKPICINHNPKELVRILSSFTDNNNTLKYAAHSWDMGQLEDKWKDFDKFMDQLKNEWNKLKNELRSLKPQLTAKISNFMFRKDLGEKDSNGRLIAWGEYNIEFGWSSKELKEWCNNGEYPAKFFLPDHYRKMINGKSIDRFENIVQLFKNEIEIRSEEKRIKQIFREIKNDKLGKEFKLKLDKSLDGIDFYTDVQHLKNGLAKIFEEIAKRTQYSQIKIKANKNISEGYIDISIIHIGSFSNKESIELIAEVEDGDFSDIKKSFCSLCDWSIRDKFSDGSFQVNYLGEYEYEINKIDEEIEGFTHTLRFYK